MKRINFKSILASMAALVLCGGLQSCDDYLTVYPTNQIIEEEFWQDQNDVDNVRAGAYQVLTKSGVTAKMLVWGEFRSDNVTLNKQNNTAMLNLKNAVLMPSQSIFDWAQFYTGINYCNLVLEKGAEMVESGIDPGFTIGEWRPIKAEMTALKALFYFYLVRAYHEVPYVNEAVTTDEAARNARIAATPGVAILGDLIDSLEAVKDYAAVNFGSNSENCGRFTRRGVYTLLADMYLWRGCLLRNHMSKSEVLERNPITSLSDVVDSLGVLTAADGTTINNSYCNDLAKECFKNAMDRATYVIDDMNKEFQDDLAADISASETEKSQAYPLIFLNATTSVDGVADQPYNRIWGSKNSRESIFDVQFDGSNNINSTLGTYYSTYSSKTLSPTIMVPNTALLNFTDAEPDKGWGKADFRALELCNYSTSGGTAVYPCVKNIASSVIIKNMQDMSEGATYDFRESSSQNGNWPVYRLADVMLIKAEATARYLFGTGTTNTEEMYDAFDMVNTLFMRANPGLRPSVTESGDMASDRIVGIYTGTDRNTTGYYAKGKNPSALLELVYRERQREFACEGKFWFDIVRQAEFSNDPTTTLTTYCSLTTSVKNRLKQLYSLYNPVYSEEMDVNGVDYGGQLVQNPVWERYSQK